MDGVETARLIHANFDIPVIFVTAYADDDILQRVKVTEPHGFIMKPFEARELHIVIEMALYKFKMEKTLRESEERFRLLAENIPEIFWITSPDFDRMVYVSPAYEMISGRTCESLYEQPKSWIESIHKEDRERISSAIERFILGKENFKVEYRIVRPDGATRWISDRAFSINKGKESTVYIVGIAEDITERKLTEEKLRKLSTAVEQSPSIIVITDKNGIIEYVNPKFTEITGYKSDEVVGKNPRVLQSGTTPREKYEYLWKTISSWIEWRGEFYNKKKCGELYWEHAVISPIKDPKGLITHYISIKEDITAQKKKDRLFLLQARQAQMGEMIAMIAHQWRQPLTSMGIIAGKTKNRLILNKTDKESVFEALEKIQNHIKFLSQTIDDFRDFFKPHKSKELVKVRNIIEKCLDMVDKSMETSRMKICASFESEREIETYPNELMQVFLNILKNTEDIVKDRNIGNAKVHIKEYEKDGFIIIEIIDNVGGIPDEIIDNIFLPYFSTKDEKQGTGLGLYISKTIVEEHCKGEIMVENINEGARFTIRLPINN